MAWLFCAAPAAAYAQAPDDGRALRFSGTLDAGVARIHYDDYLPSGMVMLAPAVRLDARNALVIARGSVARFESGNYNSQGALAAGLFTPPRGRLRGEVAGLVAIGHHQTIGSTGTAQGTLRLHLARGSYGGWLGAGGGWSALGGGIGARVGSGEAGAWARQGAFRLTGAVHTTSVNGLRYTDADAVLRWVRGPVDAGIEAGFRLGDRTPAESAGDRVWAGGDVALWLGRHIAIVGAVGRFLPDPGANTIGGRHATVSLRYATRAPPADEPPRVLLPRTSRPVPAPGSGAAAERLDVVERGDGRVVLRFHLPGARQAELMADFTDWEPIALRQAADGAWTATIVLAPGVHRVNLRTDGGRWRAPPSLTAIDDGFGGEVGLLVVRR